MRLIERQFVKSFVKSTKNRPHTTAGFSQLLAEEPRMLMHRVCSVQGSLHQWPRPNRGACKRGEIRRVRNQCVSIEHFQHEHWIRDVAISIGRCAVVEHLQPPKEGHESDRIQSRRVSALADLDLGNGLADVCHTEPHPLQMESEIALASISCTTTSSTACGSTDDLPSTGPARHPGTPAGSRPIGSRPRAQGVALDGRWRLEWATAPTRNQKIDQMPQIQRQQQTVKRTDR